MWPATGMPLAFITLVDDTRSCWKAVVGAGIDPQDVVSQQNTVEQSFCRYLIAADGPVVVTDASVDELTKDNLSVESMGVRAWAGYPVRDEAGHALGSFCVVDTVPHEFSEDDLRLLQTLADAATREVVLRAALRRATDSLAFGEARAGEAAAAQVRLLKQAEASELLEASLDVAQVLESMRRLVVPCSALGWLLPGATTSSARRWAPPSAATGGASLSSTSATRTLLVNKVYERPWTGSRSASRTTRAQDW